MDIQTLHQLFIQSKGVATDTRKIEKGQMFFALKGDNFNANELAELALIKGAQYAIIDEDKYKTDENYILVPNVLMSLQELANFHRIYLGIPIIAITGTNGKTTSKELIRSVLQKKYQVGYTKGNFNNHIGVPLTLLSFTKETEIGVVEMGANHLNEISELCKIALPDFGIITNIGRAHLEGFGSYEGVIKAKTELYEHIKTNKKNLFVNGDDRLIVEKSEGIERYFYGKKTDSYCSAEFIDADPYLTVKWKDYPIKSQLVGEYNFNNILLAICIGSYFNVDDSDIVKAIMEYKPENNRSQLTHTDKNLLIIDAYNANPSSMELSVLNFSNFKDKNKLLILGDMFELGDTSELEHLKIIELIENKGFSQAYFVGKNFYSLRLGKNHYHFFENTDQLIQFVIKQNITRKTILLKASRGVQLEKIIPYL